jgi:hypothetical protein
MHIKQASMHKQAKQKQQAFATECHCNIIHKTKAKVKVEATSNKHTNIQICLVSMIVCCEGV